MLLVWVFLAVAILTITTSVVAGALALKARKGSDVRLKYSRVAITAAALTAATVVLGAVTVRATDMFHRDFPNDVLEPVGADTFLGTLVAST